MNRVSVERKPRILVIEDNSADVDLLRRALDSAGVECEVTVIDDGADALTFVRASDTRGAAPPDLAIVDLNLPKHGGLEIVEEMRASRSLAELPVIILSSSSAPRDRATLENFHIARYIVKPPDLDEFLKIGAEVKELLLKSRRPERSIPT